MIDLHTHTSYSDGTWDVKTLLENAKKNNVELLSITDHDSVKAHLELKEKDYSNYYDGKIITGAEFNCVFNNAKIELLGYKFDIEEMSKWIEETYNNEQVKYNLIEEFNLLMNACHKNNIKVDDTKVAQDKPQEKAPLQKKTTTGKFEFKKGEFSKGNKRGGDFGRSAIRSDDPDVLYGRDIDFKPGVKLNETKEEIAALRKKRKSTHVKFARRHLRLKMELLSLFVLFARQQVELWR